MAQVSCFHAAEGIIALVLLQEVLQCFFPGDESRLENIVHHIDFRTDTPCFRIGKLARYLKPGRDPYPVKLYSIEVSEKTYRKIKDMIEYFIAYKSRRRYTTIGLFLSILRIPYQRKFTYFCSQFVAHVLQQMGIVPAHHNPALYLPQDLSDVPGTTLLFSGNMQTLFVYLGMMIPADYTVKT